MPDVSTTPVANMDFNGETNTAAIVSQLGANNGTVYAAKLCADLVAYGFDDWYLPAMGELNEMYLKLGPVADGGSGQITTGVYWSSTEVWELEAWRKGFDNGGQLGGIKDYTLFRCRCVRK